MHTGVPLLANYCNNTPIIVQFFAVLLHLKNGSFIKNPCVKINLIEKTYLANYCVDLRTACSFANQPIDCDSHFSYTKASDESAFSYDISGASLSHDHSCFWSVSRKIFEKQYSQHITDRMITEEGKFFWGKCNRPSDPLWKIQEIGNRHIILHGLTKDGTTHWVLFIAKVIFSICQTCRILISVNLFSFS